MKKYSIQKKLSLLAALAFLIPAIASAVVQPTGRGTLGDLTISGSRNESSFATSTPVTVLTGSTASTTVAGTVDFTAGDYVLIHQTLNTSGDTGTGYYEIGQVQSITGNDLLYTKPLTNIYGATGAQVQKINEYHDVTVGSGGTWTVDAWDDLRGGILVAMFTGDLTVESGGVVSVEGKGFAGGAGAGADMSWQGDSSGGPGAQGLGANGSGGGGNQNVTSAQNCGGGGGGHAGAGSNSGGLVFCQTAVGGAAFTSSLTLATTTSFGGGGGGGSDNTSPFDNQSAGSAGGGFIFFMAGDTIDLSNGETTAKSGDVSDADADGGAGAGGSMRLAPIHTLTLGTSKVFATAGSTQGDAGAGSAGRVATISGATVTGTSGPTINTDSTDQVYDIDSFIAPILGMAF